MSRLLKRFMISNTGASNRQIHRGSRLEHAGVGFLVLDTFFQEMLKTQPV